MNDDEFIFTFEGRQFFKQYASVVSLRDGFAIEIIEILGDEEETVIEVFRHDDKRKFTVEVKEGTPFQLALEILNEAKDDEHFMTLIDEQLDG